MPVDCEVFQGNATITIEHLTGEVKPLEAKTGDRIPGGARNLDGRMIVKVCSMIFSCLDFPLQQICGKKLNRCVCVLLICSESHESIICQKCFSFVHCPF